MEQSRVVFGFIKEAIAGHEKEYRIAESYHNGYGLSIRNQGTRLGLYPVRMKASNGACSIQRDYRRRTRSLGRAGTDGLLYDAIKAISRKT